MSELASQLARLLLEDRAILFVGAGLREELGEASVVHQIAEALAARIHYEDADRSLPAVAQDFQALHGRPALLLALREEFSRLLDQPSVALHWIAEAVLPGTKVITTQIDRGLEQALDALGKPYVTIVRNTSVPFLDESRVTLIKIQGDIEDTSTLVITEDDIADFLKNLPTIGDLLRAYFATKTLIFLGYDLASDHFKQLFRQVSENVGDYGHRSYLITTRSVREAKRRYWQDLGVEIHHQNPRAFLEALDQAIDQQLQQGEPAVAVSPEPELPARPYKALESYAATDAAIFSGREGESRSLAARILGNPMTVLYGESGSGKTSLLLAGAGPQLAQVAGRPSLLAVTAPAAGQPLADLLQRSLAITVDGVDLGDGGEPGDLVQSLIRWQRSLGGPIVVAVDQFEQFFLVYDGQAQARAAQLLSQIAQAARLVLVIREDYLGRLQTLAQLIPGVLDVRFRLERLGREAARGAVVEPARRYGVTWEPALVETLLDDLYEGAGGVAPPQLQIVCDRLYRMVEASAGGPDQVKGQQITFALYRELGGSQAILGDYLEGTVNGFPPGQQDAVRNLLGALASQGTVKRRLGLDDLARAAWVALPEAGQILDMLAEQRLVQRFGGATAQAGDAPPSYELTHDYLVARIWQWLHLLGESFWNRQKAYEILREAVPDWLSRRRLLSAGDVQLVAGQLGQLSFSAEEERLLYASAVASQDSAPPWQEQLAAEVRREVLISLLDHPQQSARQGAARSLGPLAGDDDRAGLGLAHLAVSDADADVRLAGAAAIADALRLAQHAGGQMAVEALVRAVEDPQQGQAAMEALVGVRDQAPVSADFLPPSLQAPIRRRVWRRRWQRSSERILTATTRGAVAGFLGMALGLGPFLALNGIQDLPQLAMQTILALLWGFALPVGLIGILPSAGGAFLAQVLCSLEDGESPWRNWAIVTVASALLFAVGLVVVMVVLRLPYRGLVSFSAYLLLGSLVAGSARWPREMPWPVRLALTVLVGTIAFVAVTATGWTGWLIGARDFRPTALVWFAIAGAISAAGFFGALGFDYRCAPDKNGEGR